MKIIPLSEGSFTIDHTKIFLPFEPAKDDLQQRPRGSLLVEIQPFLVETKKDLILLDTGLGFSEHGVLQLYNNLALHGYSPGDITMVLMSHMHRDHGGGLTIADPFSGLSHLSFPHAVYYINKMEFDFALHAGNASYDADRLSILEGNEHIHLIGDHGIINGYIQHIIFLFNFLIITEKSLHPVIDDTARIMVKFRISFSMVIFKSHQL